MPSLLGLQPPALLKTVLDGVGVALAVIDKDGKFAFTNHAAQEMFGDCSDLIGVSLTEWRRDYKFQDSQGRDIPPEEAPILRALAGEPLLPQFVRMIMPDGRSKWLHAAGHQFSVMGLTGVFVVITDETEQFELHRAAEQHQRLEAVGLLAGRLAHDFNNMLSLASENVTLALSDPGVPEITRTRLQQMAVALEKGATLSRRLSQYSRARKLQIQLVSINEVVETALELVRPLLGNAIRLKTDLQPNLPALEADPGELEQVLVNLFMNALDAMPEGGELALRTELAGPALTTPVDKDETPRQYILISVADTGIGIPEDLQSRIFEPSFTTKPGKGAGLGLSSAYGIVRQHGGYITVQSAPAAGAKFNIYLPVAALPEREREIATRERQSAGKVTT
jgi:two-component system, cell cycle sensor histidine kinase and response regulator CckA